MFKVGNSKYQQAIYEIQCNSNKNPNESYHETWKADSKIYMED